VERPAHGIAVMFDIFDELVEEGMGAALGRDDGERTAPLDDRFRQRIESTLISRTANSSSLT
jgi:hypothetical protein